MVGKWHNTPTRDCVPSAPRRRGRRSRGFDTFYGFMEGEAHFFFPAQLMLGNQLVPIDEYPRDYYTTDDWTDQAIRFVKELRASAPRKPFFLYVAHNAVHAPLQAKPQDLANTAAATTWAGRRYARRACGSRSSSASCRRIRGCRCRIRACRRGTRPIRPTARCSRATWKPTRRCSIASIRTSAG